MEARLDEIGDGIFRVSVFLPHVRPPAGMTFNEFIVLADEPLLFHCGHRKLFPVVSAAVAKCCLTIGSAGFRSAILRPMSAAP
jgi:hypothetical protein